MIENIDFPNLRISPLSEENRYAVPALRNALLNRRRRSRDDRLDLVSGPAAHAAHRTCDRERVAPPLDFRPAYHFSDSLLDQTHLGFPAVHKNGHKLIFAPAPDRVGPTHTVLHRLRHYGQNRGYYSGSPAGPKIL
jgi:hypothetical protein